MTLPPPNSLERLTHADLIGVVRDLIGEVTRMQAETEKLGGALAKLRVDHQAVKDELARLKHLPPRPPIKPSGMDKSTQAKGPEAGDEKGGRSSRRRGSQLDRLKIGAIIVVKADPPAGSRNKGFEDIVVQDLSLNPQVTRYRRERWETPDGKTIIAALDPGLVGGYGPHLHRLVLTLHFSGQVTCERITALLNGMGVVISKRQVVRLLTAKLETFRAEDEAVLKAGLCGAYVTVDDTGARHAGKNGYTTQIGSMQMILPVASRRENARFMLLELADDDLRQVALFHIGKRGVVDHIKRHAAQLLRARFDRIFKRASTGYVTLDRLLRRLFRNKDGLLRVLERPEIPINTNSSENDIRAFVTKRKISGGTVSDKGRDARDIMLGLAKTCMKLKLSFYEFIGARLGIPGPKIPPLASLIRPAPA